MMNAKENDLMATKEGTLTLGVRKARDTVARKELPTGIVEEPTGGRRFYQYRNPRHLAEESHHLKTGEGGPGRNSGAQTKGQAHILALLGER